ncbi:MAG: aldehyde ferredoxin oxidoreductase C-terminal domain-containing protein, partial [Candidatus Bathyarchaeia archaeon]
MNVPIPDEGVVSHGSYVSQEELDFLLDDYYQVRGWTKEGIPTIESLNKLGLSDLAYIVKDKIKEG